jgi:hypothetical protein
MRITIIPSDSLVIVDGKSVSNLDLSAIPTHIHAIQWYDKEGEIEWVDELGRLIKNETIVSFDEFQWVIDAWAVGCAKEEEPSVATLNLDYAKEEEEEASISTLNSSTELD